MDAIFTLPFSEYEVINELKKNLKGGCSYYVPTSRQQKGIDFIIHNNLKNKFLRIQVKGSRAFINEPNDKVYKRKRFQNNFWFNNFIDRYVSGNADYYILFGLYPEYKKKRNIKSKGIFWKDVILCFSEKEMFKFLNKIKKTRNGKVDPFFGFSFDSDSQIFATRGFNKDLDISKYLLKNKVSEIKAKLKVIE